jgi:hypothetical protein
MRRYGTQIKTYPNRTFDRLVSVNPEMVKTDRDYKFSVLDSDGIAHVGEIIRDGQGMTLKL